MGEIEEVKKYSELERTMANALKRRLEDEMKKLGDK